MKANLAAHGRDLRLDLVRGTANWSIFLSHIPHNAVSLLTLRNFGFSGAADLFFFTAGYAAAILYGRIALERGLLVAATRILKRLGQLYAAYVVLFVMYLYAIGSVAAQFAAPDIIDEYKVIGIVDDPIRTLLHGVLLKAVPLHLDGLQLFIVLMAGFSIVFIALLRWPNLTMAGSLALYVVARHFDLHPWSVQGEQWYFNPFCWQLVFVFGAWLALKGTRHIRAMQEIAILRQLALAYLLFALVITMAGNIPQLGALMPDALMSPFTPDHRAVAAARLGGPAQRGDPAAPQMRRGVAALLLRRRVPLLCRAFRSYHQQQFVVGAGIRQRRGHRDDDGRRLLRLLVAQAGSRAGPRHRNAAAGSRGGASRPDRHAQPHAMAARYRRTHAANRALASLARMRPHQAP
jgi:hypothetical protein